MTSRRKTIRLASAALVAALLAGCHSGSGSSPRLAAQPTFTTGSASISMPAPAGSPAGEAAALDAAAVARAFTAAICPYSWRNRLPYGQQLNTALTRWATPAFAAARRWSPARTATAAAGLVEHQAQQTCGQVTGGLDPEADPATGGVAVRLSVTVTAAALEGSTSSAQQVFDYQLVRHGAGWLISSGQW